MNRRVILFSSIFKANSDAIISDVRVIFGKLNGSGNANSLKFVDVELTSDNNGLWSYEDSNFSWSVDDSIEYWLSVETSNLGYYLNRVFRVQGNERDVVSHTEQHKFFFK